ncbi:hypothetical protein [Spiroplasma phoeniceum]|uniref:Uncharacterized protein n=1 Tax=Spiroplasma phoeniceum P40 TaxID=1276259 RepID=A0A345DM18_9MOLU|nr:hypothetical protein [Spiroplasma phoeniceum]AXF95256.1 hypothetical protein SDAV_00261 [Spiroplasma phoeniceum P40]
MGFTTRGVNIRGVNIIDKDIIIIIKNENGTYWQRLGFEQRNPSQSFKALKNRKFLKYDKYPFHIKKAYIMRYNALSILYNTPFLSLYGLFLLAYILIEYQV